MNPHGHPHDRAIRFMHDLAIPMMCIMKAKIKFETMRQINGLPRVYDSLIPGICKTVFQKTGAKNTPENIAFVREAIAEYFTDVNNLDR
jgi:hypothetical protein